MSVEMEATEPLYLTYYADAQCKNNIALVQPVLSGKCWIWCASIIIVHACVMSSLYLSISNTSSSSFDEHNFYGILTISIYDIK